MTFVVIISGILIAGSVMLAFRLSTDHKPRKYFGEFIRKFEQKIVSDIGIPPDTIKAREIADELEIGIRFESQNFIWSNDKDLPSMELLEKEAVRILPPLRSEDSSPPGRIMRYKNVTYSIIDFPEGHFIIDPINPDRFFKPEKAVILSVVFVLLIVSGMYFYLRYLFTPLKSLTLAVQSIGEGNYDVKVPEGSSDELGELGHAINDMSGRISEAMKAKEQLLIDVSHELRSPITRIKLGLELGVSSEKLKEDLCEMEKMVSGMLDNYRSDNKDLRMAKTELVALIKDIINEYSNQERLEVIDKAAKYFINCDSERIRTVLRNIIDNSLKYSEKDVIIDVFSQGRKVIVSVTDQGIGISEDDLKYIFEPFYRADPSRSKKTGGFGLGLSICKKIMSAHKGEIKITSNLGSGTEVRLIFRQTEENYQ
ncbi:MAG: HAMP domain-containing histidine kinase [Ignavibacteria bacterium]|nr:HAMP domain-containing histidine kinase [Ignavibacteria bacterium]